MRRNSDIIVAKNADFYDITCKQGLDNPKLFYTLHPYSGEETFLADIHGNQIVVEAPASQRCYFIVKSDNAPDLLAGDRVVDIPAVANFRDQGGYLSTTGKTVKWGRFFRGAAFANLSDEDKTALDELGIRSIFDYRDQAEHDRNPDYATATMKHHLVPAIRKINIDDQNNAELKDLDAQLDSVSSREEGETVLQGFLSIYADLPFHNPAYTAMFDALDSEDTVPLYQHCTMGKDRTGVGCAMLLMALGVDVETALGDYHLSAMYRALPNKKILADFALKNDNPEALSVLSQVMTVKKHYLQISLDAITRQYPDFETFLKEEYSIAADRIAHWRALHLA